MKPIFKTKRAFTLVELLVVIAIIGLLAALTVGLYSRVKGKANESAILAEMEKIKLFIQVYKEKHGYFPPSDPVDRSRNQLWKNLSGRGVAKGKDLVPNLKPPVCQHPDCDDFDTQGQCVDPVAHRASGLHSGGQYDFLGNLVSPALDPNDSNFNARWNYNSKSPTHNRETYDLWVTIWDKDDSGTLVPLREIGNW
jgi:prepilin-type N-terminal cleavage/methylation domain-containing protein